MDWEAFIDSLPASAKEVADPRIPHKGAPSHVIRELNNRGYVPVDLRFASGEELVEMSVRGGVIGTIELDTTAVQALNLEAKLHGLLDKDRKRSNEEVTPKTLDELLKAVSTTSTRPHTQVDASSGDSGRSSNLGRDAEVPLVKPATNTALTQSLEEDALDEILDLYK